MIQLETSDDVLIDKILYIRMHNNLLYVAHSNFCSVFNMEGDFLYRIGKRGNGPGEYNSIEALTFTDKYVIIYDDIRDKLFFYNHADAEFSHSVPMSDKYTSFKILKKDLFVGVSNLAWSTDNRVKFFDINGIVIDSIRHNKILHSDRSPIVAQDGNLFTYNDAIYFKEGYNDTVFRISQDLTFSSEYVINTGKYAVNYEDRILNFEKYIQGQSTVVYFENDRFLLLQGVGMGFQYILIDKKLNKFDQVDFLYNEEISKLFEDDRKIIGYENNRVIVEDIPSFFRIRGVSEDGKTMMDFEYLKEYPDNNPVIVLVRLKE